VLFVLLFSKSEIVLGEFPGKLLPPPNRKKKKDFEALSAVEQY